MRGKPDAPAGKPVIGLFGLPALAKLLAENAVFIAYGIPSGRLADGGKPVKKACRKPPQTAVAKTGIRFLFVYFFGRNAKGGKGGFKIILNAEVIEVVAKRTPHKELHGKVIYLFVAAISLFRTALGQKAAHHRR